MESFRFEQPPGPLAWAVCLSVVLHVGLLAIHVSWPPAHERRATSVRAALGVRLMHARLEATSATRKTVIAPVDAMPMEMEPIAQAAADVPPASALEPDVLHDPVAEPAYFDAKELSERPRFVGDLQFAPDDEARVAQLGEVDVEFFISDEGGVDHVLVFGQNVSAEDQQWLTGLLSRMQLVPGRLGNETVRSRWHIRIGPEPAEPAPAA